MKPGTTLKTSGWQSVHDYRSLRPTSAPMEKFPGKIGKEYTKNESTYDKAQSKMRSNSVTSWSMSDIPNDLTNLQRNRMNRQSLSNLQLPVKTGYKDLPVPERYNSRNSISQGGSLQKVRSNSLPMLSPMQRRQTPPQRNAVGILSEHGNMSKQKSSGAELMNSEAAVQQRRRSCPSALTNPNLIKHADQVRKTKDLNIDAFPAGVFAQNWENSLADVHGNLNLPRFNSLEINKPGECGTPATTASCSPASTARCSSSEGRASLPGRRPSMPTMQMPVTADGFDIQDFKSRQTAGKLFALLDKDDNHCIDASEWYVFYQIACQGSVYHDILRLLFKAADVDENGMLDEKECMTYTAAIVAKIGPQAFQEIASKVTEELHAREAPRYSAQVATWRRS